jgi:hypothetical protein
MNRSESNPADKGAAGLSVEAASHGPVAHPVTHEKDLPQGLGLVGVGIGIAFGIEIALGRHVYINSDSDPDTDSDPEVSRFQFYFRSSPSRAPRGRTL